MAQKDAVFRTTSTFLRMVLMFVSSDASFSGLSCTASHATANRLRASSRSCCRWPNPTAAATPAAAAAACGEKTHALFPQVSVRFSRACLGKRSVWIRK